MKKNHPATNLFGQKIFSGEAISLLKDIENHLKNGKKTISIFTPNPEQIVLSKKQKSFAKTLGFADILLPDGVGVVISSQFLALFGSAEPIKERIAGVDVVENLLTLANENSYKVLVVGGKNYDGLSLAPRLSEDDELEDHGSGDQVLGQWRLETVANQKTFSKPDTIWWVEGFDDVNNQTKSQNDAILKKINQVKPDIVFVAFGAPYQEEWVVANSKQLESAQIKISMVVGGAFDMLLGKVSRAPKFMQSVGLEWLFRLIQEPWRWRRQLNLVHFVKLVVQEALK